MILSIDIFYFKTVIIGDPKRLLLKVKLVFTNKLKGKCICSNFIFIKPHIKDKNVLSLNNDSLNNRYKLIII